MHVSLGLISRLLLTKQTATKACSGRVKSADAAIASILMEEAGRNR